MLQFKELKPQANVFILNKQDLQLTPGKVTSVSFPKMSNRGQMVVDVTIEANNKEATYEIPENSSITWADNLILSTTREGLVPEVENLQNIAKQGLAMVPYYNKVEERVPELLAELNPIYREKQETEKRFNKIESTIGDFKKDMADVKDMMRSLIKELKN